MIQSSFVICLWTQTSIFIEAAKQILLVLRQYLEQKGIIM